MLKRTLIIMLFGLMTTGIFAQISASGLYDRYSDAKNINKVQVSGLLMWMIKPLMSEHFKGTISGVKVLSLDECAPQVKEQFNRDAAAFNDKNYELFLKTNDKDDKVRIYVKFKKDKIREMIILTMGDDPNLISIKGKISPEDVEKMVGNNKK